LKQKLDLVNKDMSVVVDKLSTARRWLDGERQIRKRIEVEKDALIRHLDEVRRVLFNDPRQLVSDEAKEKLQFLNRVSSESSLNGGCNGGGRLHLNTIAESDSFSDMSFSRSADDLDDFPVMQISKKHRTTFVADEPIASKKRKSSVDGHFISPPPPPFPVHPRRHPDRTQRRPDLHRHRLAIRHETGILLHGMVVVPKVLLRRDLGRRGCL
jgi:hypothetical protein